MRRGEKEKKEKKRRGEKENTRRRSRDEKKEDERRRGQGQKPVNGSCFTCHKRSNLTQTGFPVTTGQPFPAAVAIDLCGF